MRASHHLRQILNSFGGDRRGNVATLFALALLPLALGTGAVIDMLRIYNEDTAFADAVDAATLAVAATPRSDFSGLGADAIAARSGELKAFATHYVAENYSPTYKHDTSITLDLAISDGKVSITAEHDFPTAFMALMGQESVTLHAMSEVTRAGSSLEVALILDNTGSMAESRLASLKTAAKNFVATALDAGQSQYYAKIALVPYNMGVNVGSAYASTARGAVSNGSSNAPGSSVFQFRNEQRHTMSFAVSDCVSERVGSEAYTDAPVAKNHVGLNYAAPANPCGTAPLLALSNNRDALDDAIDSMTAVVPPQARWGGLGWYALSPRFGLWSGASVPAAYGTKHLSKVAILMTDGEFNSAYCNGVISQDSTNGSGSSANHIDCDASNGNSYAQSEALCSAMKAEGVVVYTIAFDLIDTANAQELMTLCASGSDYRYDAADEEELQTVFDAIARRLTSLRISR